MPTHIARRVVSGGFPDAPTEPFHAVTTFPVPDDTFRTPANDLADEEIEFGKEKTVPQDPRSGLFLKKTLTLSQRNDLFFQKTPPLGQRNGLFGQKTPPMN